MWGRLPARGGPQDAAAAAVQHPQRAQARFQPTFRAQNGWAVRRGVHALPLLARTCTVCKNGNGGIAGPPWRQDVVVCHSNNTQCDEHSKDTLCGVCGPIPPPATSRTLPPSESPFAAVWRHKRSYPIAATASWTATPTRHVEDTERQVLHKCALEDIVATRVSVQKVFFGVCWGEEHMPRGDDVDWDGQASHAWQDHVGVPAGVHCDQSSRHTLARPFAVPHCLFFTVFCSNRAPTGFAKGWRGCRRQRARTSPTGPTCSGTSTTWRRACKDGATPAELQATNHLVGSAHAKRRVHAVIHARRIISYGRTTLSRDD